MFMLFSTMMVSVILTLVVGVLFFSISMKEPIKMLKNSPFECGFSPWENSRQSFSLQFFMVSLIFLIFDVELTILFPVIAVMPYFTHLSSIVMLFIFFIFMFGGLMVEWASLKLDWIKY